MLTRVFQVIGTSDALVLLLGALEAVQDVFVTYSSIIYPLLTKPRTASCGRVPSRVMQPATLTFSTLCCVQHTYEFRQEGRY
jgi:hypothetical protein